ncbi:hypothetical protein Ddc_16882 [Ditylenchus destructor]|nr:hypothetical protein Ddc_16882 [Ditylenchus destructor]
MERPIRNPRITLPADIQGEVLRHFSRKDLSQQIYLVNRQHYNVATSHSHVPVIHFIEKVSFAWSSRDSTGTGYTGSIHVGKDRLWEGYFQNQVGIPGPFVRFRHVSLKLEGQAMLKCQGPAMLRFLRATKESFVGCKLNISVIECSRFFGPTALAQNYIHSRVCNLLQNVFQSPLTLTICDGIWMNPEALIETTASSNCCKLELHFNRKSARCTETTNMALLDWLKTGYELHSDMSKREINVRKKHLVLESYPEKLALRLIERIKEDFEYLPSQNAEFLLTVDFANPGKIWKNFARNISTPTLSLLQNNPSYFKDITSQTDNRRSVTSLFVRFGQVTLKHLQGQAMLKFLREARDTFVGCKLNISVVDCLKLVGMSQSYVREQVRYLLQNIFHSPLSVTICDQNWYDPESIIESKGCSNCCKLELHFNRKSARCNEITNRALLEWLDSGYKMQSDMSICEKNVQKKHLVLESYPRKLTLSLIERIKKDFEYVPLHNTEFVITFIQCRGSPLQILEKFDEFSLDKTLTAERLSFFKYNPPNNKTHDRAYRLWRRSVTNEAADSVRLSFLQSNEEIQGNVKFDQNLFSFEFPLCNKPGLYYS